jgi:MFS family permease
VLRSRPAKFFGPDRSDLRRAGEHRSRHDGANLVGPETTRAAVVAVFVAATRLGQTAGPLLAAPLIAGPGPRAAFALGTAVSVLLALVTCRKIEEESPR